MSRREFTDDWDSFLARLDAFTLVSTEEKISISNGTQTMIIPNKVIRDLVKLARAECVTRGFIQ